MTADIFNFWADVPGHAKIHPADETVFSRVKHGFELGCLLGPYRGPLKDAPVVFLFLSPRFDEADLEHAKTADAQSYYADQRSGTCPLPSKEKYPSAWNWTNRILRQFSIRDYDGIVSKIAFLNIGAYKSKEFTDWHMLAALPSSRVTLDWAQSILFPQAERGERVVVCMRSAGYWGLETRSTPYGKSLFVPNCTRGGVILKEERQAVINAVQQAISR